MVQKKLGWKEVGDDDDWQVYWTDTSVSIERIMRLKRTQVNKYAPYVELSTPPLCVPLLPTQSLGYPLGICQAFGLPPPGAFLPFESSCPGRYQMYICMYILFRIKGFRFCLALEWYVSERNGAERVLFDF